MTSKATPLLQLQTLVVTDARNRIFSTREPHPSKGPAFLFIRGESSCAWAVRADVAEPVALKLNRLASEELPSSAWDSPLRHMRRYAALMAGRIASGPAFKFPDRIGEPANAVVIDDEAELDHHFSGWIPGEINAGRAPVLAVRDGGIAASICFCARRSDVAAEAGIETAAAFRGRGHAATVASAWAARVRQQGLIPIYSTDWANHASLAVARTLKLVPFAADFSISD